MLMGTLRQSQSEEDVFCLEKVINVKLRNTEKPSCSINAM